MIADASAPDHPGPGHEPRPPGQSLYMSTPRQATWLELFFDLIFVVALGKLTHLLAHSHHGHISGAAWASFFAAFVPLWWIWVGHTLFSNRFDADTRPHRIVTLTLMLLVMSAAILISDELHHGNRIFAVVYGAARLMIAGMHFAAARAQPDKAAFARRSGCVYTVGALVSASAALMPTSTGAILLFYGGLLIDALGQRLLVPADLPVDRDHLVERIGLLAIILLGESVISITAGLDGITWDGRTVASGVAGFVFIAMIWWIYFDSFPLLIESERDPNGDAILFSQLLTYASFAILANTIRHAILDDLALQDFRILTGVGVTLFYLGKQTAYYVNRPEYRPWIWLNTVVMFLIAGLAMLLLPSASAILLGVLFSLAVYILMNLRAQFRLYGKAHM